MNDDYPTPEWLMKYFKDYFDPCPLKPKFDGLKIKWRNPTYANIPYSDPEAWVKKAIEERNRGIRIVMLTRVDPSTKWWLELTASGARVACFFGRIKFTGTGSPNFASALWFL